MTNLTLSREMQNMAERLADNAHDIWAKKKKEELITCGQYRLHKLYKDSADDILYFLFCSIYSDRVSFMAKLLQKPAMTFFW